LAYQLCTLTAISSPVRTAVRFAGPCRLATLSLEMFEPVEEVAG
jgi:hypothetical protein